LSSSGGFEQADCHGLRRMTILRQRSTVTPIDAHDERRAKQIADNETVTKIETELFKQP
jgi:hypothetical protein